MATEAATTPGTSPDTAPTLRPMQVAKHLKISHVTAIELMKQGRIKSINVGTRDHNHYRTSEAWLAEYIAGKNQE